MREIGKLGAKLFVIALFAGVALGATNAITAGPIAAEQAAAAERARIAVLPEAVSFEQTDCDGVEAAYVGMDAAGNPVGATGTVTVTGFVGPIEITVGVDGAGVITGVSVGGSSFAETAGLGAKTRDAAFTAQFAGENGSVALKKDGGSIDAVTSATISSAAVTNGVAAAATAITPLAKEWK